jgi:ABC-2 type transport system permease protein
MKSRIPAIARKEFSHILRDWRTLGMTLVLPVIMVLLFGYAITFDLRDVRLAVYDGDKSPQSRELIEKFTSSGHFRLVGSADDEKDLGRYLEYGLAQIAVSIPYDYSENIVENSSSRVAVLVEGTAPNNATIAAGYVQAILAAQRVAYGMEFVRGLGLTQTPAYPPINPVPRFLYNAEMRSQNYIVPGLIGTIMMVMTALLTSLTIVRERERGSLELLLATPVRTYEIMIGKMTPYFAIGMIDSVMIAVIGILAFRVPFAGSVWLFLAGTALFAMAGLGVGLLISTVAGNQVVAMQMAILTTMLPSYLLSGFMFPIKNMPDFIQPFTYIVTARYYMVIARNIFLKGAGFEMLWPEFLLLLIFTVAALGACVKKFHKRIG